MYFVTLLAAALLSIATPAGAADTLADALRDIESGHYRQAVDPLSKLASQGNPVAQYHLGLLYYQGHGLPENELHAVYWWREAAAQGDKDAMFQLGSAYLLSAQVAKTVPDPDREAAIWYFQAASAGHAEAQYHLGLLFLTGKGVVADPREAARWLHKAADQGYAQAQKALTTLTANR